MTGTAGAQETRYAIDARGSRLTVHAYATGLASAIGHDPIIAARDIQGEERLVPGNPEATTVTVTIAAASLAVQNDVSDKDRREIERAMSEDVLEVSKYPEIVYTASAVRLESGDGGRLRVEVDGKLTLHGVTRSHRVSARLFLFGDALRAQGESTLRQSDFGIKPFSAAGGTLKIKDELTCVFELLARQAL